MLKLTKSQEKYYSKDIYNYFKCKNVIGYSHVNYNSYLINININTVADNNNSHYLILDTKESGAFFHWIAECAIYLPFYLKLKEDIPDLKIVFKEKKTYHNYICDYFGIDNNNIEYSLNDNNICYFPLPISALNENDICDDYKKYVDIFLSYFQNKIMSVNKNIDILILPRQTKENYKANDRISNVTDIINNVNNPIILNTDDITDISVQINKIKESKTIIISDGSPYLFNGLFAFNSKIIVLGNDVKQHLNNFIKLKYFNNIIQNNNCVVFIPYLHGTFYNNNFLYDDIKDYL